MPNPNESPQGPEKIIPFTNGAGKRREANEGLNDGFVVGGDDDHLIHGEFEVSKEEALAFHKELEEFFDRDSIRLFILEKSAIHTNEWTGGVMEVLSSIESIASILNAAKIISMEAYENLIATRDSIYRDIQTKKENDSKDFSVVPEDGNFPTEDSIIDDLIEFAKSVDGSLVPEFVI